MSLEINDLSFSYSGKSILEKVSFQAHKKKITGILGPNGSGKTTLLKCISRILPGHNADLRYENVDLTKLSVRQRSKYIAYVPQENTSVFPVSVIDTILMGRIPYAGRKLTEEDKNIAFEILEQMELEDLAFSMINQISGGERQRVLIARALAQQTPILLMDEPTNNLDLRNQMRTMELLEEIVRKRDMVALVSLHDINLTTMYSDMVLMLKDRELFRYGVVEDVITESNLKAVYGVDTRIERSEGQIFVKTLRNDTSDAT